MLFTAPTTPTPTHPISQHSTPLLTRLPLRRPARSEVAPQIPAEAAVLDPDPDPALVAVVVALVVAGAAEGDARERGVQKVMLGE